MVCRNGAYLRLKDIVLGYTFPKNLISKTGFLSNLRVYVAGADLWEKSYINDGWDPEATRKVENKQRYPFNRTITFGINATSKNKEMNEKDNIYFGIIFYANVSVMS